MHSFRALRPVTFGTSQCEIPLRKPVSNVLTSSAVKYVQMHVHGTKTPCAACEDARREAMEVAPLADHSLERAGAIWLQEHSRYIKPRTINDYKQYIKALSLFFEGILIKDI